MSRCNMSIEDRAPGTGKLTIVGADRFSDGVMVFFAGGEYAFFPAQFLHDHLEQMVCSNASEQMEDIRRDTQ